MGIVPALIPSIGEKGREDVVTSGEKELDAGVEASSSADSTEVETQGEGTPAIVVAASSGADSTEEAALWGSWQERRATQESLNLRPKVVMAVQRGGDDIGPVVGAAGEKSN